MNADGYLDLLLKALPTGRIRRDRESNLARLLGAFADGAARIDARMDALLDEADPRTATETIDDWERLLGLPDACTGALTELADRQAAAWQKYTATGGQSRAYFIEMAQRLGFTITIDEFRPCYCDCDCDAVVYGEDWHFAWGVNVTEAGPSTALECVFNRLKPAQTVVFFTYGV